MNTATRNRKEAVRLGCQDTCQRVDALARQPENDFIAGVHHHPLNGIHPVAYTVGMNANMYDILWVRIRQGRQQIRIFFHNPAFLVIIHLINRQGLVLQSCPLLVNFSHQAPVSGASGSRFPRRNIIPCKINYLCNLREDDFGKQCQPA